MQQKILDFLRQKQEYLSGEEISSRLKISRQALWKHIQQLKDAGYDIVAVPHLGYRLQGIPDRLFPSEISHSLNTSSFGKRIYYFETLASTMDTAEELALKGAAEGTLVLAESQTKGRGRLGRHWHSPKYKGLYFSLILRPQILPNSAAILTLLSAVSAAEAIKKVCALEVKIKWPNDLFLQQKKVGGILTEMNAETDITRFVVAGIGLNVNNDRHSLAAGATSLKEEKREAVNRVELLQELLRQLEQNYLSFTKTGAQQIIQKWRALNFTLGKRVKIACHDSHLEGLAVDVDLDGSLLLRKDSGLIHKLASGDLSICR